MNHPSTRDRYRYRSRRCRRRGAGERTHGFPVDALLARLTAATRQAVMAYESGVDVEVAVGDVWLSVRVLS